ncbi:hypothetical protein ACFPA1_05355 [Neobacillus sp. GCM10023253]|uniref:hypothetical protein n=1 Tax=Neobacillus sp. GCM10023253 TaxID=3252644 RepID=UPI00361BF5C9
MMLEKIVKVLGFIAFLGGIARMGMTPSGLIWESDSTLELIFAFAASILMAISSMALFMSQSRQTGVFGFISGLILSTGNLMLSATFYGLFAYGDYPKDGLFVNLANSLSYGGLLLATVILMIVTFRAKVFPRWYAIVFLLMLVCLGLPFLGDFFAFFWGLTYVLMGYSIFTGKGINVVTVKKEEIAS